MKATRATNGYEVVSTGMATARSSVPGAPLVSVIVPAYNCAPYIAEAIDSVLAQDYARKEVIVVDDGSTDGTADAVRQFGDKVTLATQPNAGPAAARNRGARLAKGDVLAFLDGDDVWLPGKLAAQVDVLVRQPEIGVVYGDFARWHPDDRGRFPLARSLAGDGDWSAIDRSASGNLYTLLLLDSAVCIITVVVRRSVFEEAGGFDESLRTGEDYDLWLRISRRQQFVKLRRRTALYRMHPVSTTKAVRPASNELVVLEKAMRSFGTADSDGVEVDGPALRRRLGKLCFDHGYLHLRRGTPSIAFSSMVASMKHSGFSLRASSFCVASLFKWAARR